MNKNKILLFSGIFIICIFLIFIAIRYNKPTGGLDEAEREVIVYFSTKDAMYLQGEKRIVMADNLYKNTLAELIKGPESSMLSPTIPKGVKIKGIEVEAETAYLDFNQALIDNHWGGSTGESLTIYSIINTMTQFPEIKQVQILVEGEKIETIAGHIYLMLPLEPNESMVIKEEN